MDPLVPPGSLPGPLQGSSDNLPVYGYEVINTYPHDTAAFTQGLIFMDGYMYEGTGLYGASTLRKVVFESGTILKIHSLDSGYFGEGVTIYHDTIRQLTWRNDIGFVYIEGDTFECIDTFSYTTEGWGLTHNDTCLIMSDGTPVIHFLDPVTYQEIGQITVTAEGVEVRQLNELEYIQGMIYANVWYSDSIAVIDPADGHIVCWIDCTDIISNPPNVLNGIAFDPLATRLFVTGKRWPALFEIKVEPINYPPIIHEYFPPSPCSIAVDSNLLMGLGVWDPDPEDTLTFVWKVNGVIDTTVHDTMFWFSSSIPTVDTVVAVVCDGMHSDSVVWIVHVLPVGIEEYGSTGPSFEITIPDPCTPDARIIYSLAMPDRVRITLYDVAGREVATLVNGMRGRGVHSVHPSPGLSPGIYFIHFNVGTASAVYKRVVIH
ncbi:glutaminyl-peptide cyclotransferase [candidate division WOR-3 bacterium]|nr:glutaminyl-peptide cyclotransferase [candidate division WOR-3 bacterium]